MYKRLLIPIVILACVYGLVFVKQSRESAIDEMVMFIDETATLRNITLTPQERKRMIDCVKVAFAKGKDSRGCVNTDFVKNIKNQFEAFIHNNVVYSGTIDYYSAVKELKKRTLAIYNKYQPHASYKTRKSQWLKLKKQFVDKELRKKAFIDKDLHNNDDYKQLVVKRADFEVLVRSVTDKATKISRSRPKKEDRMISMSSVDSKIKEMLRHSGYRKQEQIKIIMVDIEQSLKKYGKKSALALSKLEEIALAAMKRFKKKYLPPTVMSRLAAEVRIFHAIKKAGLTQEQEIIATNEMMDAISTNSVRGDLNKAFVEKTIKDIVSHFKKVKKPLKRISKAIEKKEAVVLLVSED